MNWRSLLFAPGTRPDLMAKLPRAEPDVVVLDLEDAVPHDAKAEAREHVALAARGLVSGHPGLAVFVRVNAVPTEYFDEDLGGLPDGIRGIMVPKIETSESLGRVGAELGRRGLDALEVIVGIETVDHPTDGEIIARARIYFKASDRMG